MIFDNLNLNVATYNDLINQHGVQLTPVTDRFNRAWHISNNWRDAVRSIALFIFTFGIYHIHVRRMANKQWKQVLCINANAVLVERLNNELARQDQVRRIAAQVEQIQGLNGRIAELERDDARAQQIRELQGAIHAKSVWLLEKNATIAQLETKLQHVYQVLDGATLKFQTETNALKQEISRDQQVIGDNQKMIEELEKQVQDQLAEIIELRGQA